MAKKELPKAQLGAIVKGIVKGYQGAKAGVKLASKIKARAKNIKAIGVAKKEKATIDAAAKAERTQKAAETRAANAKTAAAAKNSKTGTTKTSTTKTSTTTPTPPASKGKEPFVKSKARLATENVAGKLIGGVTFGTGNVVKKVLKNRIAQSIIGGGTTAYVMNKIAEGRRPVKIKKIKKK